jgi:hypothetical protein
VLEHPLDSPEGRSLRLVQDSPGPVVFLQQSENFSVVERVAPTADDSQEFWSRAEPFQQGVKLAGDLCLEIAGRPLPCGRRIPFVFASLFRFLWSLRTSLRIGLGFPGRS